MTQTKKAKYRVGAIGCGRKATGQMRAFALNPMSEVVAGADPDPDNLGLFCKRFNVPGYSSYEEMLDKEQIDIAAPILPVIPNPEVVIGCARRGVKAIFCEKPICVSLEEADRMVEECRSRGIPFAAADAHRNWPQLWRAREIIESGQLGDVESITVYSSTNEISGGGCQQLSVMRMFARDADVDWVVGWMTGEPAEDSIGWSRSDTAPGGWAGIKQPPIDEWSDDDQGMGGYVRFTNGIETFVHCKKIAKQGIEVLCSRGLFFTDWRSFHLWKVREGVDPKSPKWADFRDFRDFTEVEGLIPKTTRSGMSYDDEGWIVVGDRTTATAQSVIDSLEKGIEPRCSGDDWRKALEIAIAFRESHRRDFSAVKLPLQDRSLKIIPKRSRMLHKKEVRGREWYAEEIARAKRP